MRRNRSLVRRNILSSLLMLGLLLQLSLCFLSGCGKQSDKKKVLYTEDIAKLISGHTAGLISSKDPIVIRFTKPVVEPNMVGSVLKNDPFTFRPNIDGMTAWKDNKTLEFKPNQAFEKNTKYQIQFDVKKIFPKQKDHKIPILPLGFEVQVVPQEVDYIEGDFYLIDMNNPERLVYKGAIGFIEPLELEAVKRSVSLVMKKKPLELQWTAAENGREFTFISEPVNREDQKIYFVLALNKDELGTATSYKKEFYLYPLQDLTIIDIKELHDGKNPQVQIKLSDGLDRQQDITGLVEVEPDLPIQTSSMSDLIYVYGDFNYGETYTIEVHKGIRSIWGAALKESRKFTVKFEDIKPEVKFVSTGTFLPSTSDKKIRFQTVNLKKVNLEVLKVFETNIGQYLQTQNLDWTDDRYYNTGELKRVGINVAEKELFIGEMRNEWLTNAIDLSELIPGKEKGLFIIKIYFTQDDMLYPVAEKAKREHHWDYNDPNSEAYIYRHGEIVNNIVLSDLGIVYKQAGQSHIVFVADIPSVAPVANAKVTLMTYQDQIIQEKYTDSNGKAVFNSTGESVFYIQAERNGERSVLKPSETLWNTSSFDVDGKEINKDGTRVFIYTERGVYRPGDEINITLIARNKSDSFPENHPVTLELYNPKEQLIYTTTNKTGKNGVYCFKYTTNISDPTGNWKMKFKVGSSEFQEVLKIETVVPNRLKVEINPAKNHLYANDRNLEIALNSSYLFGAPASDLKAEIEVASEAVDKQFATYKDFTFSNQSIEYKPYSKNIFEQELSSDGKAQVTWKLPKFENIPSALNFRITARVYEKGGRPNQKNIVVPADPYDYYIGIKLPDFKYGYSTVGKPVGVELIVMDKDGNIVTGKTINYTIYKNSRYWWWEYKRRSEFQLRYKSNVYTEKVKYGGIQSGSFPVTVEFKPEVWGEYLIEASIAEQGSHTAGVFFRAVNWGDTQQGPKDAGQIVLKADKDKYAPGEIAKISFPCPDECTLILSIEKANEVLSSEIVSPRIVNHEATIEIPITGKMLPNVYVSVCLLQPHAQSVNDRPIRTYGIIPLLVEDSKTRQELRVTVPEVIRPDLPFNVEIQTEDQKQVQFTVAVVDEGLLDLTNFQTPDPWQSFYSKERLGVKTFDLYSYIIGANIGDVFKTFSIGGDYDEDFYRKNQKQKERAKRFRLVSQFAGPLTTDRNGYAKVPFKISDYIGSVRIMVVTIKDNCYGSAEKTVPVKNDLMVLPALPRVLGNTDEIKLPVTLFAMADSIGPVTVTLKTEGPLTMVGETQTVVELPKIGETDVEFGLKANNAVGKGVIVIEAKSKSMSVIKKTEIDVRANSPRIYKTTEFSDKPGENVQIPLPNKGVPGTNHAQLQICRIPNMKFGHRLSWLMKYPYGCVEQTVSSVFPQLYLTEFQELTESEKKTIDYNIDRGIMQLANFQTIAGGLSYWPGGADVSYWGTTYAFHFLIEAQKRGYYVPSHLVENLKRFEKSQARTGKSGSKSQVYRLYVLALAGDPEIGPMNFIKESMLSKLDDSERWLLAGAYKLAGVERSAFYVIGRTGIITRIYVELSGSYGSGVRDKAIILEMLTLFELWEKADPIFKELCNQVSSNDWYSTQTLSYSLLSIGKYITKRYSITGQTSLLKGTIILPNGSRVPFNTNKMAFNYSLDKYFGQNLTVEIDPKTSVSKVFLNLDWDGIPLKYDQGDVSNNLKMEVEWFNENGGEINPDQIRQGTSFWEHIRVERTKSQTQTIEELALVQFLPAGWEIENIRLTSEAVPSWMKDMTLYREDYTDIRDDHIMWFFDLPMGATGLDFVVKINAVTQGKFDLPPTKAEAMYDNTYQAIKSGMTVEVTK
ncbi:MAG: MG2 domain-containing protein [Candidatus Marinimicrobia bacterium]|nr:MG2 domain-containing protein [Candidatus Neomarinimicrobiota bacterium]MCK9483773.1 MG2 domain-containing protein [Candidatus Neomarinimicrobiota bacterium]